MGEEMAIRGRKVTEESAEYYQSMNRVQPTECDYAQEQKDLKQGYILKGADHDIVEQITWSVGVGCTSVQRPTLALPCASAAGKLRSFVNARYAPHQ